MYVHYPYRHATKEEEYDFKLIISFSRVCLQRLQKHLSLFSEIPSPLLASRQFSIMSFVRFFSSFLAIDRGVVCLFSLSLSFLSGR